MGNNTYTSLRSDSKVSTKLRDQSPTQTMQEQAEGTMNSINMRATMSNADGHTSQNFNKTNNMQTGADP